MNFPACEVIVCMQPKIIVSLAIKYYLIAASL